MKRILTSSTLKNTTQGVTKCKTKRCKICDIIVEGKPYTFKNPESKFKINKNLSCNLKNVVYVIECNECKEIWPTTTVCRSRNSTTGLLATSSQVGVTSLHNISLMGRKYNYNYEWKK